jgi:hypothetical protein
VNNGIGKANPGTPLAVGFVGAVAPLGALSYIFPLGDMRRIEKAPQA